MNTLTIDGMRQLLREVSNADPIANWMRAKGFDPDAGCKLIVPEGERGNIPERGYIHFSRFVDGAYLINPRAVGVFCP